MTAFRFSDLSDKEKERVRKLYVETDVPTRDISRRFGRTHGWLTALATREKWPPRRKSTAHTEPHTKRNGAVDGLR